MLLGLQRAAGNRAVGTLVSEPSVQRDKTNDYKSTAGETLELAWTIRETKGGVKFSFKATVSRQGGKVLESPTTGTAVGDLNYSLGENKATLERASGKFGRKVSSALAQANWVPGKVPGFENLQFRLSGKGPEAKFDLSKGEAGLDLLKIQGAVEGDMSGILDFAGLAHWKDRVKIKGAFQVEKGISVADLARLKSALVYVDEAKKAAAQAEKYAADFAHHRAKLNALDAERKQLEKQLIGRKQSLARATRRLESVQGHRMAGQTARAFAAEKKLAEEALQKTEKALLHNNNLRRVEGHFIGKASKGLAAAGKRLSQAGHKLDKALAKLTDKLAKPVKEALEKVTAKIMKKLAGTLLAKGLKYLIPGLNLVSTLWDIGSLLWDVFNSSDSDGVPGGGGGGDGKGAAGGGASGGTSGGTGGGTGSGGSDTGSSSGDATSGSGQQQTAGAGGAGTRTTTGTSGTPPAVGGGPTAQLVPLAKELLEAFRGDPLTLDDAAVETLNQGVPTDLKPDEKAKLLERLRAAAQGGAADPYELVTEIQAQLAEIRAGADTVEFGTEPPQAASKLDEAKIEPPKTLLPFTRTDALSTIAFDTKQQKFVIRPAYANVQGQPLPPHPDGLRVKLTAFDVETSQPSGGKGQVMVKLTFGLEVVSLPAGADATYPYKTGEAKQEKMSFLYDPKAKGDAAWGEMDFSHIAQLRALFSRSGGAWTLTGAGKEVRFSAATVRVDKLLETKVVTAPDGTKVTKFAVLVTPTEILASRAGYTSGQGWVDFVKNKSVPITFELPESPATTKP